MCSVLVSKAMLFAVVCVVLVYYTISFSHALTFPCAKNSVYAISSSFIILETVYTQLINRLY